MAQIPDFFDPLYDPEQHILTPEQVRQHHVLSCKIYEHDELINTIVYDHDGRVISDKNGLYFYKYSKKKDRLFYVGIYHRDYGDSIDTYLHYNEDGQLNAINLNYLNSDSQQLIEFAYYDDGPLGLVGHQIMHPKDNEFTMIRNRVWL